MKRLSIVGAVVLFAACQAEEIAQADGTEPTHQAVALEFRDQIWLGEFENGTLTQDRWVDSAGGSVVGPFHLDGSRLVAFSCCSAQGGDTGYRIVDLDLEAWALTRYEYSLGYQGKKWTSFGTLIHVGGELISPGIHFVDPEDYESVDPTDVIPVDAEAIGSTEIHLSTSEDLLFARVGRQWGGIASKSQGVWSLTHVLPADSPVHGEEIALGDRKAVIWRTDRQSLVVVEVGAAGFINERETPISFPLDRVVLSPDDTIALLSQRGDEGPFRILDIATGTIRPLDTTSSGSAMLLPTPSGVRILWGSPALTSDGLSLPWTDVRPDGTVVKEGEMPLSNPLSEIVSAPFRMTRVATYRPVAVP